MSVQYCNCSNVDSDAPAYQVFDITVPPLLAKSAQVRDYAIQEGIPFVDIPMARYDSYEELFNDVRGLPFR